MIFSGLGQANGQAGFGTTVYGLGEEPTGLIDNNNISGINGVSNGSSNYPGAGGPQGKSLNWYAITNSSAFLCFKLSSLTFVDQKLLDLCFSAFVISIRTF